MIKQTITYTNGRTGVKYFKNVKDSQTSMAISMCSPVVKDINPEIISEEQYKAELNLAKEENND
ncbi:hypothetical protein EOL99_04005 [Candidatus Falkowbacteria bacterium]|nr:hypothetical protein [Candidatus Falkowbacteria bacterium]